MRHCPFSVTFGRHRECLRSAKVAATRYCHSTEPQRTKRYRPKSLRSRLFAPPKAKQHRRHRLPLGDRIPSLVGQAGWRRKAIIISTTVALARSPEASLNSKWRFQLRNLCKGLAAKMRQYDDLTVVCSHRLQALYLTRRHDSSCLTASKLGIRMASHNLPIENARGVRYFERVRLHQSRVRCFRAKGAPHLLRQQARQMFCNQAPSSASVVPRI